MVNAAAAEYLSPERLSTKALAAAGQFRAIALWLNEPLIPHGIYAQVAQDQRPGCIRITVEFDKTPHQKPLIQYICHLMWQLNSPLIEGIHLIARPLGTAKPLWQQRIRVMTPALRERLNRLNGQGSPASIIPPSITTAKRSVPNIPGVNLHLLLSDQLKTVRACMLTGSAVAAFILGCMVEVVMSDRLGPSLPFQTNGQIPDRPSQLTPAEATEPQLPTFPHSTSSVITVDRQVPTTSSPPTATPVVETTSTTNPVVSSHDRPNVVNAALEPVGVLQHEQVERPNDPTVTLLFGGEVDLDALPFDQLEHDSQLLSGLPASRTADLAMVNLQDPLAVGGTSLQEDFLERQRPDAINLLKAGGVDVVNLAGKASLSLGEQGLAETIDTLDTHGMFRVGAGRHEWEARRPEVLDVKGQRIAYLSYDRDAEWGAYDDVSGVNAAAMPAIMADIEAIRDEVDWLVVNFRWTGDPPKTPAESPTNLARMAIKKGADVVIGQHPSELQGAELYRGRPIAYSLGDFVFGQATEEVSAETAVLQVALGDGRMKVDMIPVTVQNGQPQMANAEAAQRIFAKIKQSSAEFSKPLPASVVLDARTGEATSQDVLNEADSFTGIDEDLTAPDVEALPTVESEDILVPHDESEMESDGPAIAPEAESVPPDAIPTDDTLSDESEPYLDIELGPIPEDLLENWGQKESPNTIYEPESLLPDHLRPIKPTIEKEKTLPSVQPLAAPSDEPSPSGLPKAAPKDLPATGSPQVTPDADDSLETVDVTQPNDAIGPYSEPLVGPLSTLPETVSDMKLHPDGTRPQTQPLAGMPESRVFVPLNELETDTEKAITIDIDSPIAISPNPPNNE